MAVQLDRSGKQYVEVPALGTERTRATLVPAGQPGYGVEVLRPQVREESGRLRYPATDIPLIRYPDLLAAIEELLRQRR